MCSLASLSEAEKTNHLRNFCKGDLYFLLRYGLKREFCDHDWWFDRCREVQAAPNGYIDLWSREHGKSTVITIALTIFDILNDPEITVGIFSHTRPIAKSFMRVIKREFETNAFLKELFPDILYSDPQKESPKWSEDDGIVVKRKGNPPESTIEACGLVDGMPTGRHFQLRVYDDVVTRESVNTPEQMLKTIEALDMSSNLGKVGGIVRMIGTRYKLGDAYEEYAKRGKYKARIKPATDNGRVDGKPVFFTQEEWDSRLLDMSPSIIASQMMQNPLTSESVIFQPEWFKLWPHDKPLPEFDAVFQCFDGAFSEKTTADYSCLMTLGLFKAKEGDARYSCFVLDCFMDRLSYPDMRDEVIRQFQSKYGKNECPVHSIIIEDKASGSALIPDLRRSQMNVVAYNPGGLDKISRANLVSHLVRDGYLWIPESANPARRGYPMSWLSGWYEQMTYFPNTKHDDGVDATTMGLIWLEKNGYLRGRVVPPRETSYWRRQQKKTIYG
jgi:predicted phage terminase large subunit-like protein